MAKSTDTKAEAARIWAQAGGDLDQALDLRDEESAENMDISGREWAEIEDHIWEIARNS